ncbi:MAG: branched-chain amino acid transaminase [Anaerolineae bacterium]|jgi:branched-chain amino acid aminotransferase|nr:branched-chain amino acid transaminase [Anaerolineae bacterium]
MANQGRPKYAFLNGDIVPIEQATVGVMTHALHYGTAVFGGLRGYWNANEEQLYVMRPHDHFKRLLSSASLLRMHFDYTPEGLTDILMNLLRAENFHENCYIRPLMYKSTEMIGVRIHDVDDGFTMFALPFGRYVDNEEGAHVCFSSWVRVEDNAIPARGKIAGAYANSSLIKSDAILSGYDEAITLNQDGHISEMSAANLFLVRDGKVYTPGVADNILEGITRRSIIQLLRDELHIDVIERNIDRTEVYISDELFMCGTGVQVAAITRVEHRQIGDGKMGEITQAIRNLYFDVVSGRVEKYRHWLTPVYVKETVG